MKHIQKIQPSQFYIPVLVLVIAALAFSAPFAGGARRQDKAAKHDDRSDKLQVVSGSEGHPVLWKQPENVESLDLFYGPGSRDGAPDPSGKFSFEGRDKKGTQKKIYVKDDKGQEWTVKFGEEARPETVATRIVWAMGYHADQDYFVPQV